MRCCKSQFRDECSIQTATKLLVIESFVAKFSPSTFLTNEDRMASALKGKSTFEGDGQLRKKNKRFVKDLEDARKLAELNRFIVQASDADRLGNSYLLEDAVLDDIKKRKPRRQLQVAKRALTMSSRLGKKPSCLSCKYVPPGELPIKKKKLRKYFKSAAKQLVKESQSWSWDSSDPYAYGRHARQAVSSNPRYNVIKYGCDLSEEREVFNRIYHPDKHLLSLT